jgi:hypothetical protein
MSTMKISRRSVTKVYVFVEYYVHTLTARASSDPLPTMDRAALRSYRWRVQLKLLPANQPEQWATILTQQRQHYHQLAQQHPFPDDNPTEDDACPPTDTANTEQPSILDPLTAMMMEEQEKAVRLQELDLKYRRERARRKRGLGGGTDRAIEDEEYDAQEANLQIIDKDLDRLPWPESTTGATATGTNCSSSDKQRKTILRQVLFVYTCEHPDPGYRQGMHEISSYLLYALQVDTETAPVADLEADTYSMLVTILSNISPAYDSGPIPQPLATSSRRILTIIAQHDTRLHYELTELHTPPQLYLTKWMRLLFSREVSTVLELWDALFFPSVQSCGWMTILEYTAAARLLLWRMELLQGDASSRLHLLMNLPVQSDIQPLVRMTRALLDPHAVVTLPELSVATTVPVLIKSEPADPAKAMEKGDPASAAVLAGLNRFSLSAVKQGIEQAKTQTETIKKKLEEKWESMASNQGDNPSISHLIVDDPLRRSYDDPLVTGIDWSGGQTGRSSTAVAQRTLPHSHPSELISSHKTSTGPLPGSTSQQWAQRAGSCSSVLQDFIVAVEKQNAASGTKVAVPVAVWEALADLEVLRRDMMSNANNAATISSQLPRR